MKKYKVTDVDVSYPYVSVKVKQGKNKARGYCKYNAKDAKSTEQLRRLYYAVWNTEGHVPYFLKNTLIMHYITCNELADLLADYNLVSRNDKGFLSTVLDNIKYLEWNEKRGIEMAKGRAICKLKGM